MKMRALMADLSLGGLGRSAWGTTTARWTNT
jgi:hypothetical protein